MEELSAQYDPQKVEDKWYKHWLEKGYFRAEAKSKKPAYTIVIPPPNITGELHYGHALNNTLQDILIRWKRMQGYKTLWLPGTDHSGIAAQWVVEKELASQGLSREDLGREKFLEKMWEWKEKYGSRIISQLKKLGSSCDWSRERFTMDEGLSRAVKEVFIRLYEEGLIYQDDYIINWCPRCQTALSDLEAEHKEAKGYLYYIRYPLKSSNGFVVVATTRPETMLGDTGVAVHPQDKRYLRLKGKTVILPLLKREIPLISEELVDPDFGTGAVKITPAHDPNDFEIGRRANLPVINVMNEDATMNEEAGKYKGMERLLCRKEILKDLEKEGYLEKVEEHLHSVGHCYRCQTIIEPRISRQWFVKMKELARPAIKAVKEGKVKFVPASWSKTYFEWMENIKDWCISRQIWWGHQIPLWYCDECKEIYARLDKPGECKKCKSKKLRQETDVLDTWFSSALWPFSTLGWPEETEDLAAFYPTSTLITAPEIIFFWVARMIMMGLKFKGEVPFEEVYIHATVRDEEGKKMSKSLGNVLDPLQVIDKYGTDALRFALAAFTSQGRDIYLSEERIEGYRNFANKIWNASRFTLMNLDDFDCPEKELQSPDLTLADRWILTRLNQEREELTQSLENDEFGGGSRSLYRFIWHEFCDWYVELAKLRLYEASESGPQAAKKSEKGLKARKTTQYVLVYVLERTLRLLHPFMPFISEEIWQKLPSSFKKEDSIMISPWPKNDSYKDEKAVKDMQLVMEVTNAIRNIRGEMNVAPRKKAEIILKVKNPRQREILQENAGYVTSLGSGSKLTVSSEVARPRLAGTGVVGEIEIYLPLKDIIDPEKERTRLTKEIAGVEKILERTKKKLENKEFLTKAPPEIIEKQKVKRKELEILRKKLEDSLKGIEGSIQKD